jgi:hypothetical protein
VLYQAGDFVLYYAEESAVQRLGQINGIVILKEDSKQNLLRIQKIVYYRDLPGNMRSSDRLNQSNNRTVWLTEEREIICVDSVINHVNIWLEDLSEPGNYDYRIKEILYTYNNQQKIREIQYNVHQLPYHNFQKPPGLRHLKFFVDLYFDDFGAFGKSYHKIGGLYIQFGNMTVSMRQCLKNHFLISLIPFGTKFC